MDYARPSRSVVRRTAASLIAASALALVLSSAPTSAQKDDPAPTSSSARAELAAQRQELQHLVETDWAEYVRVDGADPIAASYGFVPG